MIPADAQILVVDDDALAREMVEYMLAQGGYQATHAASGIEALSLLDERGFDLVLLDIEMPGLDGFEVCRRIRARPDGGEVAVLFITGVRDPNRDQQAIAAGADDFLTKPVHRTELLVRVRSLLRIKRLRAELARGYALIRAQNDALIDVQRQKDELAALVVHDLKSPLATILGSAEHVAAAAGLDPDHRDAIADIQMAAEMMRRMILNLLDISRSEDGTLVPQPVELDLAELVDATCAGLRRRAGDRGVHLASSIAPGTIARADRDLLRRVIENVIDNAIRYAPWGSEIAIAAARDRDGVELRIADLGPGIPPGQRDRIFDKYAQVAPGEAPATRGLGLTFCRLAVEAHGGTIRVEPNTPAGSVFCVRLPG